MSMAFWYARLRSTDPEKWPTTEEASMQVEAILESEYYDLRPLWNDIQECIDEGANTYND